MLARDGMRVLAAATQHGRDCSSELAYDTISAYSMQADLARMVLELDLLIMAAAPSGCAASATCLRRDGCHEIGSHHERWSRTGVFSVSVDRPFTGVTERPTVWHQKCSKSEVAPTSLSTK